VTDKKTKRGAGVAAVFTPHVAIGPPSQEPADLASRKASMPAKQQPSAVDAVEEKRRPVKATYYMDRTLIKRLKFLSVELDTDLSSLVNEAVRDLVSRHS
jgi:hypothetical protein